MTHNPKNLRRGSVAAGCALALCAGLALYAAAPTPDARVADAAEHSDIGAVRNLVNQHADVNGAQGDGTTALMWAVRGDDRQMAAFLLTHGADLKAMNHYGVSALSLAADDGSAAMIADLLKAGADPKATTSQGETMLMAAARSGHLDAVQVLLDHGADVNAKEPWQQETALMFAAAENHADVVKLLIAHGADPNARAWAIAPNAPRPRYPQGVGLRETSGGLTPLLLASRQGAIDAARALVENGADPNLGDPIVGAALVGPGGAAGGRGRGAQPAAGGRGAAAGGGRGGGATGGYTPMIVAIMNAHYDLAAMLLEKGANPNAMDSSGRGPLFAAVDMHRLEWLFSRPTPKSADKLDSAAIVELLLKKGANVNARLTGRVSSFQHDTQENGNLIAGATPFLKAAVVSDVAMMKLLLANGADPNATNGNGSTALMMAAGLNWRDVSSTGTEKESIEAIQICLDHGADVNAADKQSQTAVHGAAQRGADSVLAFLVSKGAKLDVKSRDGRTPLDDALGGTGSDVNGRRPERTTTVALIRKLLTQGSSAAAPAGN